MSIATQIKGVGSIAFVVAFFVCLLAVVIALVTGAAEFSVWVLKWTFPAFAITFLISLFLLALAMIPTTRGFSAVGLLLASFVFGAILWLWGMGYTYSVWGITGVLIGIVFLGVGVVPVAMFTALIHGDWGNLCVFVVSGIITFGLRALAGWLAEKVDERNSRLRNV